MSSLEEKAIKKIETSPEFRNLARFFENPVNFNLAESVLTKKKKISLRVVEYVAANSRKFFFDVENHGSFRDVLDNNGKRKFDIFRRFSRFTLSLGDKSFTTNLAQLKFFQFSIQSGVLNWLIKSKENVKKAEDAMKKDIAERKKVQLPGRKKRKRELKAIGASNVTFRF